MHEFERHNTSSPAFLHFDLRLHTGIFVFLLFEHHVRFYLTHLVPSFGLKDFKVGSDDLPRVVEQLIDIVGVEDRMFAETGEQFIGDDIFLAVNRNGVDRREELLMQESIDTVHGAGIVVTQVTITTVGVDEIADLVVLTRRTMRVADRLEERLTKRRQERPIGQRVYLTIRDCAVHGGIEVPSLCGIGRIDITRDIEIIAVRTYLFAADAACVLVGVLTRLVGIDNTANIGGTQFVLLARLDEAFAGIDKEDIVAVTFLAEHHNDCGDTCAEEDVCGQTDDGVDMVVLNEVLTDHTFYLVFGRVATEEDTVRQDDGHYAVWFEVIEVMEQESVVGFAFGRYAVTVTRVEFLTGRTPRLGVRRVADHGIEIERRRVGAFVFRPVLLQRIGVTHLDVTRFDASHNEVHSGEVERSRFEFLREIMDAIFVVGVLADGTTDIEQQRAGSAGRVVDRDSLAVVQITSDNLGHQNGHFVRGVELTCFLTGISSKLTDKVLVDETEHVITLTVIGRDVFDEREQIENGF